MKKILQLFALLFALVAPAMSQAPAGYVFIHGSKLTDSSGNPVANGTIYFAPVTPSGAAASYRINGNGQAVSTPVSSTVTNGVFSFTLADTNLTAPQNVCFAVTVVDNVSGNQLLGPGYGCVQPAANTTASPWCVSGNCDFDQYPPNLPAAALVQTGPQGPAGATGAQGPSGAFTQAGFLSAATYAANSESFAQMMVDASTQLSTISISTPTPLPAGTTTVSANRNIEVLGGGQFTCPTGTCNLVFSGGGFNASPSTQAFGTNVVVTGLKVTRPEWWGPNGTVQQATAALGVNGGQVLLQCATYNSGFINNAIGGPYVDIEGCKMADFNSTYTDLINGTVVKGPIPAEQGANFLTVRNLGIDTGSDWTNSSNGGNTTDGFSIANAGQVVGAPQVRFPILENVSCLGSSTSAPQHCALLENVYGAYAHNIKAVYDTHGVILKGQFSTVDGVVSMGHNTDGVIVKSDNYAPTNDDTIRNVYISDLSTPGDTAGMIVQAVAASMADINIDNLQVFDAGGFALEIQGQSSTDTLSALNLSNVLIDWPGGSPSGANCIELVQFVTRVNMSNINCSNYAIGINEISPTTGGTNYFTLTNSSFVNNAQLAIGTFGTWTISNTNIATTALGIQDTFGDTYLNNVVFNGATQSLNYLASSCTTPGECQFFGPLNTEIDLNLNPTFSGNVSSGPGIFGTGLGVTVTSLSTPTVMLSEATSGLLRIRDNTLGGSALLLIDPNSGAQLLGTSQITGLTSASQITFNSTNNTWDVSLSTGSVPRVLSVTMYD